MKRKKTYIIVLLFFTIFTFGQKQQKIYYNSDWKGCTESQAKFYRLVTFDTNNKPIGKIRDYFISGELQGETDSALIIDKNDDNKSILMGHSMGYFKSGKKFYECIRNQQGNKIAYSEWYLNGNLKFEATFKNGKYDGIIINYYENGKIQFKKEYHEGKLINKWYTECDEFEKCQKVFFEGFETNIDDNEWHLLNNEDFTSVILSGQGLLMETKTDKGYAQWVNLPIDITKNFSIETILNFQQGVNNTAQGLIYGFKDWDNYYYFYISADGFYRIGAIFDGLSVEYVKWTASSYLNKDNNRNLIKINKFKDKVYFSINGQIVHREDFYAFTGNNIGFYLVNGKKKVLFEKLIIKQDIDNDDFNYKASSNSKWKGNGTGFFIDPRGYIVTNYHVVDLASEIEIDFIENGQKKSYKAKVISNDKDNDLSIIKIDDAKFITYPNLPYTIKTQKIDVGSSVFTLGYPMALSIMGDEIKFTDGKISSKTGYKGDTTTYQISVPVQPGNSGCPLFDYDGNIVGIVNAKVMAAENVSYAVKSYYLINFINILPEKILVPKDNLIQNKPLTEKIKILSDYVVMIKIK